MCGRYQFTMDGLPAGLRRALAPLEPAWRAGDVFPTAMAPVLVAKDGKVAASVLRWGFPGKERVLINARAETASGRPAFRDCVRRRRCAVLTTGFYEWDASKHRYLFRMPGSEAMCLAGLYDRYGGEDCFVILTTAPNASVAAVHDRMPLALTKEQVRPWLLDDAAALELLAARPPQLERTSADGQLSFWG